MKILNTTNKRITFPLLSFSIGPHETKEVNELLRSRMLQYEALVKVEEKKVEMPVKNVVDERKDDKERRDRRHKR